VLAIGLVAVDYWLIWRGDEREVVVGALSVALLGLFYSLGARDLASVGLRARPVQGLRYWIKPSILIGVFVGIVIVVGDFVLARLGHPQLPVALPPDLFWSVFVYASITGPLVEEAAYRLVLCNALVGVIGVWPAILVSGTFFGLLHVVGGGAAPDNLIAGFILGWVFVRSGSIVLPLALHSLGNFFINLWELGTWYWFFGQAAG